MDKDERFRIMADCSPVMLWIAACDATCVFFNQQWLLFTGKTMEEEIGYGWAEGVHPEDFQNCIDIYIESFNARSEFSMEYRLRRHDGEYRWILDTGRPYWNGGGAFAGFMGSCIDITSLKNAREFEVDKVRLETRLAERERYAVKLEAANKELEAFSYSVSHDLRAPLRAINGFILALAEELGNNLAPEPTRYLRLVSDSAEEMNRLIDALLRLSRVGQQSIQRKHIAPMEIVQNVLADFQAEQLGRNIEISLSPLPECEADPSLLKQVFANLIGNAFKYTRKQKVPKIEIGSKEEHGEIIFFVADNGEGLDMKYLDKMFGVFQRFHRSEDYEGTGVGLAITRRIIERHGGRIWVEAAVGRGATFNFTIPKSADEVD